MRFGPIMALPMVVAVFAGCLADQPDDREPVDDDELGPDAVYAPWWNVGRYWETTLKIGGKPEQSVRLVHFWNRSVEQHFYIGVADRNLAVDHALHDTNPLLGRIHWELLTPHEKGIHAHGMYTFPTEAGDEFDGLMFGREWHIRAENGSKAGTLLFHGTASDGATISYDYDPAAQWFTFIEVRKDGALEIEIEVKSFGVGSKGTFQFLRGRDLYLKQNVPGTTSETFDVPTEDPPIASLAVEINGQTNGVLRIELKNPQGQTVQERTLAAESKQYIFEAPATPGKWTIAYTGGGTFTGTIEVVGLVEYKQTI